MDTLEQFNDKGYAGPVKVFSPGQSHKVCARLTSFPDSPGWFKSSAAHYQLYLELASHPAITSLLRGLLGDNIMLWGACLVNAPPGHTHPWHSDIETAYATGKTVSVWLALRNVNKKSALRFISGSHCFGTSVQEIQFLNNLERSELGNDVILTWARQYDPESDIQQPVLQDGDALFFDGRIWHGSHNENYSGTRVALLLQYAVPEVPIRIWESVNSPFLCVDKPRPPCIMISGSDDYAVNDIIYRNNTDCEMKSVINGGSRKFLSTVLKQIELPLQENPETGWQPYPIDRGVTPSMEEMGFHISVLSAGVIPHPPHSHSEEELLIMLSGEADLIMVPENITGKEQRHRLRAGSLVYYPAFFTHTIQNTGNDPITYLMFKWRAVFPSTFESPVAAFNYSLNELDDLNSRQSPFQTRDIFRFPTRHLKELQCHVSLLQPGASYQAHRDNYDVAILLLKGSIKTLGKKVEQFGVIYYSAGESHGMENVGTIPARYLVFEFHPGPAQKRWIRIILQLRRILKSPLRQLPRNLGVFLAHKTALLFRLR